MWLQSEVYRDVSGVAPGRDGFVDIIENPSPREPDFRRGARARRPPHEEDRQRRGGPRVFRDRPVRTAQRVTGAVAVPAVAESGSGGVG